MVRYIGFIGLGTMGLHMAKRLIEAGFNLIVYDIVHERVQHTVGIGAESVNTIQEVAGKSDVIITMLPGPVETETVVLGKDGIIHELSKNKIFIDMGTSSLTLTRRINQAVEEKNAEMLDAPVSGGENGAKQGTLTIMIGGKEDIFKTCEDIFEVLGEKNYYTGPSGSGTLFKLLNNLLYSINICAAAEVLAIGEKMGLELPRMVEIFNNSSAGSYCLQEKAPRYIIPDDFTPGFRTDLLLKDINLAIEIGESEELFQIFGKLSCHFFMLACDDGFSSSDNSSIIKVFRSLLEEKKPHIDGDSLIDVNLK